MAGDGTPGVWRGVKLMLCCYGSWTCHDCHVSGEWEHTGALALAALDSLYVTYSYVTERM